MFPWCRAHSELEEDEQESEEVWLKLEQTREVKNLRKRSNGESAAALLVEEKDKISEEEDLHLGTLLSAETNQRDENADMKKYIEADLNKRKGILAHEEQKVKPKNAEECLYKLFENIHVSSAKKTEEMLSNPMLSGIPKVDQVTDAKIKKYNFHGGCQVPPVDRAAEQEERQ
ncbi:hypothetical protein SUZIE_205915 [Sciurus carolinensis]|uniref:Uncharacterized protein n=1 Tax=Sciurus carolinensis TaxID=30640 RepID=A0AA41NGN9_SCICA|nr:hypothetical protein [Sciurus carolinensis]